MSHLNSQLELNEGYNPSPATMRVNVIYEDEFTVVNQHSREETVGFQWLTFCAEDCDYEDFWALYYLQSSHVECASAVYAR